MLVVIMMDRTTFNVLTLCEGEINAKNNGEMKH